ncbi:hypothetical protein HKCCE2091_13415 [Rhodobacterales bacterium HKCCE2091]|nr:hypothetical protein [Rhodobacterales bacterium HKCCE2091]
MTGPRTAAAIEDVLARQAECLKAGDLDGATALTPRLERLARSIGTGADAGSLRAIRDRAARNETLIEAARAGVTAARRAIEGSRDGGFEGYDSMGRPTRIAPEAPGSWLRR